MLPKKIKGNTPTSGRLSHVYGLEDKLFKMAISPKLTYCSKANHIKIPTCLCRNRKVHLKICMESQVPQIQKTILKMDNKLRGFILPDFEPYHKSYSIQNNVYLHINTKTDIYTLIETPEVNPSIYANNF